MDRPETVITLSAVARNSGPFALILLCSPPQNHIQWEVVSKSHSVGLVSKSHSVGGGLKITFSGGWSGPQRTSFWFP